MTPKLHESTGRVQFDVIEKLTSWLFCCCRFLRCCYMDMGRGKDQSGAKILVIKEKAKQLNQFVTE